jgi:hypothetical protein
MMMHEPAALLPNEPRVANDLQGALTERFLLPALPALQALFLHLRAQVDPVLAARLPQRQGKPYPHGQRQEIAQAIQEALRGLDPGQLTDLAACGHAALASFLQGGGNARLVWGALHGTSLHHAFLFGTLVVDVAGDVDDPAAAPITLRPFAQSRLTPVRDHRHFALLAERTLGAHIYPNHVLSALAPYAPLFVLVPGAPVRIEPANGYMWALASNSGFASPAAVLTRPAMPDDLFRLVSRALAQGDLAVSTDAAQGRAEALALCGRYRDLGHCNDDAHHVHAQELLARANTLLLPLMVSAAPARAA